MAENLGELDIRDLMIKQLKEFIPFEDEDIDWTRTHIQVNAEDKIFLNLVGSWQYRPDSTTNLTNLYLAGDYIRNDVDVVTIEGAMLSGLNAAEALRSKRRVGRPFEISTPQAYPDSYIWAVKAALTPFAVAARTVGFARNSPAFIENMLKLMENTARR